MGILDDAINSQGAKRSQRLSREAQKSKIENNKIKEGTYRGIDLVDGTAKIQLDGQTNTTSGYKLITNAPLGDGDRVSIRPNGVGMPRADAKNVAPKKDTEKVKEKLVEYFLFRVSLEEYRITDLSKFGFSKTGSVGGNGSAVSYSNPRFKILIPTEPAFREIIPLLRGSVSPPEPSYGSGSITTNIQSPYFVYKIDVTDLGNPEIEITRNFKIDVSPFDIDFPKKGTFKDFTLTIRSFASQNNGAFSLVKSVTQKFTPKTIDELNLPSSSNRMFPNKFRCKILEYYIEWDFV